MELTIDNKSCDLGTERLLLPAWDAAQTADIEACRDGRKWKITIPATPRNDEATGFARELHTLAKFNDAAHEACLTEGGAELFRGRVRLLAASDEGYELEIGYGGAGWAANASLRMFNTLGIDYTALLTPTEICSSWTAATPVRFFPVHRDEYPRSASPTDLLPNERLLSTDDYHPFLHVATLVERIFAEAGYRIESRFLASDFFRSLYMSGAYSSRDTAAAEARMGFLARRLSTASATANEVGKVIANPLSVLNSVGNIVETATPQSVDADGAPVEGLYNNGGCFALDGKRICFTPLVETSVGFEYYLKYTTAHRILSRTRLTGFDTIYLGPGSEFSFTLANRYEDLRGSLRANFSYRIIVFDHRDGASYRLRYRQNGLLSDWAQFAERSALVSTSSSGSYADPVLEILEGSSWTSYTGDWALYAGYIGETGETTVELRIRTASERLGPASPKYFDQIYFAGAEEGMLLELDKSCSLTPRFLSGPGFGERIRFADVAQHRIRQVELLEALAQMFNLRFYTEETAKRVWIEPADDLFGAGPETDWSDRTDFSQGVERRDGAFDIHERRTWGYREGDGAVGRSDAANGGTFGAWSADCTSTAALQGEQTLRNPLFYPTIDSVGHYLNAPSALLPEVGDRDDLEEDGTNFSPRIVRYVGMHPLPEGERWGYPSDEASYPLVAFHFAGDDAAEPFTLCFEDRDGAQGLHRYYDCQTRREALRERITLTLRIAPGEYAALFAPGTGGPDIRSVFRIDTGRGVVRALLRSVGKYDPAQGLARCEFDRLEEDAL